MATDGDDPHRFDFDLDRGIREQVVAKLEDSPLLPLEKNTGPASSGIYALYFKGKLVYVRKASKGTMKSGRTLCARLNLHVDKLERNTYTDEIKMQKLKPKVSFDYITVKTTKSRIDKGLLAIPVSLIHLFPKNATSLFLLDEKGTEEAKTFTPYNSSSRECRIGGLKEFYINNNIKDGDELVVQLFDDGKFKLIPERIFETRVLELETRIEHSEDEKETNELLNQLSEITNKTASEVVSNEFVRLSNNIVERRKTKEVPKEKEKDNVPASLRRILLELYLGKCQVSGFTFLMRNGNPYFEIHHIDPLIGNHFKNLLVVSPNVHAQFTHANLEQHFDEEGWLRKVQFNTRSYIVFQIIDKLPRVFEKELHY